MFCCPECFSDRTLRREIIPLRSTVAGRCSYCESTDVQLIEPRVLREYFELLKGAYSRCTAGKLLAEWFKQDWALFEHPLMDLHRCQALLIEIFDDGEIVRQQFEPAFPAQGDRVGEWEKFRNELRYHNRFFPKVNLDQGRLSSLLTLLEPEVTELPPVWFRARIKRKTDSYAVGEMGAPPCELATHGRANPAGIPYLYAASTVATAVSETRPQTGQKVCVGEFVIDREMKFIDLRTPRKTVSPFVFADQEDVGRLRNDIPFLERLGDELTRPVLSDSAATDYTPSQYLCEFIKSNGYDGVIYRSSVSAGMNLAIFDPARGVCQSVRDYDVGRIKVEFTKTKDQ